MKRVQKLDQTGTVRLCALAAGAIFEWVKIIEFLIAFHIHTDRHTHTLYHTTVVQIIIPKKYT